MMIWKAFDLSAQNSTPVKVVLTDALREESDDLEEPLGIGAKFFEHR